MRTKQDVQLELLKELDEICSQNNLNYILINFTALDAHINNSIKNGLKDIEVAMTCGDIDKFCSIVEKQENNRYVEGIFNNTNHIQYYISYGNLNTANFRIIDVHRKIHKGIEIHIYPIRKSASLSGEPIQEWNSNLRIERKIHELLNKRVSNKKLIIAKIGLGIIGNVYTITGGGNSHYYKRLVKRTYLNNWQDIQNYSTVRIKNAEFSTNVLKEINRINVDNLSLCIPKDTESFFIDTFGNEYYNKPIPMNIDDDGIVTDAEVSYEVIIDETGDILNEARRVHEEIIWERLKAKNENDIVHNVWRLVLMTDQQIKFIDFFERNSDRLLGYDLNDKNQFEQAYGELKPVISSLRKYANHGMTFSIDSKADELIERILIINGEDALLNKIRDLKQKEFFIE